MYSFEKKMQLADILATIVLFTIACVLGKFSMNCFGGSFLSFNIPAVGIISLGETIWWIIRKRIFQKKDERNWNKKRRT